MSCESKYLSIRENSSNGKLGNGDPYRKQFATQRPQDIAAQQLAYRVTVNLAVFVVPAYLAEIVTDIE